MPDLPSNHSASKPLIVQGVLWYRWFILLIPVAGFAFVYLELALGVDFHDKAVRTLHREIHEVIALILTPIAIIVHTLHFQNGRRPVHLILAVLAVAILCREVHFAGTTKGIYIAIGIIAAWAALWFKRIKPNLDEGQMGLWIAGAGCSYLFSQVIARRAFRALPYEDPLHIALEETVENVAHMLLIITAFAHRFRRP